MHAHARRRGAACPAVILLFFLFCLLCRTGACAVSPEMEIRETVELFLRSYTEEAMLYEERDQRLGTVSDPGLTLSPEDEARTFRLGQKDFTLPQLRENIAFMEKKAAYYAGMRQMQEIYRENLRLAYTFQKIEFEEDVCHVKVTEAAGFRYTDSVRDSVNEYVYWVDLVKLDGQWLTASVTDGSKFDRTYSGQGGGFDVAAALAEFWEALQREDCRVTFPDLGSGEGDVIPYSGANAAAYAYTYSRLTPEAQISDYYNEKFIHYAGRGGDCMNFASQCMWAGFGGSESVSAVSGHALPMDGSGESQWFGRSAGRDKVNESWISCQSFRKYLTGKRDASGSGGSNAGGETGMYATILDAAAGSSLEGVDPAELIGAAAHIEGGTTAYGHAIVITAAEGLRRSQIYFCGHTKNVTHIKLGDVCQSEMKVYIPRYFRVREPQSGYLQPFRLAPTAAGDAGFLGVQAAGEQAEMWLTVTAPGGEQELIVAAENVSSCGAEYVFAVPGLYRVECCAKASPDAGTASVVFYVRCYEPVFSEAETIEEEEPEEFDQPSAA